MPVDVLLGLAQRVEAVLLGGQAAGAGGRSASRPSGVHCGTEVVAAACRLPVLGFARSWSRFFAVGRKGSQIRYFNASGAALSILVGGAMRGEARGDRKAQKR